MEPGEKNEEQKGKRESGRQGDRDRSREKKSWRVDERF